MWWEYVLGAVVLIVVGYMFAVIVGFNTRRFTRRTDRRAEDLYDSYADSPREQRRLARERDGEWTDEGRPSGGSR
jgi:prepilin signal peptidase PulO-like enzyme (type II secretory pathway)